MSVGVSELASLAFADASLPMQDEGLRGRLLAIETFQKIPGIGCVFVLQGANGDEPGQRWRRVCV